MFPIYLTSFYYIYVTVIYLFFAILNSGFSGYPEISKALANLFTFYPYFSLFPCPTHTNFLLQRM